MILAAPEITVLELPDGGRLRWAWWRPAAAATVGAAPVGTALVLGGRCEYLEKYQEVAQDWRVRGYQVLALDWRGQGRSSRFLAGPAREMGHVPSFRPHAADLRFWLDTVVAPRASGPVVLFAHSMGGLIALDVLSRDSGGIAAAVLSAPMIEIDTSPWPRRVAVLLSTGLAALGWGERYAFGQGDYDPDDDGGFEGNRVSSDPVRFRRIHDGYRDDPELKVGGVTFGWLAAAFRAQARVLKPAALARVALPVLVLTATEDQLVPSVSQHGLVQALPDATLCCYPEARHDLMSEADSIRNRVWADIDRFLARVLAHRPSRRP